MFKKSLKDIPSFVAGDKTLIQEFVHPKNDNVDLAYSLAHAIVTVGESSEPHILKTNSELYIILEGEGEIYIGDDKAILRGGDTALVPKGVMQWIKNIGEVDLKFYVIVSPPWSAEEEDIYSFD